jgi:Domain of unknown function (DUF5655)
MPRPQDMIAELERVSGRSADAWIEALRAAGLGEARHTERRAWLKDQGLNGNQAGAVLWWAKNGAAIEAGGDELIDRQYAGTKAALRPVYDRVAAAIATLGDDVEPGPRGTYVSFGRPKQFALVQPTTRTRVDVGLRLPGAEPTERLLDAGSFGSGTITHRVALAAPEDVDAELEGWLGAAYDARG